MRHVVFRLERDRYALPLSSIREVVQSPASYTRIPRAPTTLLGVMNLRGRVVTVVDLRALLGLEATPIDGTTKVVLLDRPRRLLGLLISDVDGVESIESVGLAGRSSVTVRGLARVGAQPVTVLDVDGIDTAVAQAFHSR